MGSSPTVPSRVLALIAEERVRQIEKWGPSGNAGGHTRDRWLSILGEQLGQANSASLTLAFSSDGRKSVQQMRDEYANHVLHVAAVATAMLEEIVREEDNFPT